MNKTWYKKLLVIFSASLIICLLIANPFSVKQFFSVDHNISTGVFYSSLVLTTLLSILLLSSLLSLFLIKKNMMTLPNLVVNLFIMISSFALILVFMEILFRTILSGMVPANLYSFNKFFGMTWHKPNLNINLKTSEYNVRFRTNSVGLRDDRELEDNTNNEHRILVFGDSFIQAAQVNIEHTMCQFLEAKLNSLKPYINFRIFNLGTSGCDPEYQRKFIEKNIHIFNADIMFLFTYIGNDIITEDAFRNNNQSKICKIFSSFIANTKRFSTFLTFITERLSKENNFPLGRPCQPFDGAPQERSANIFYKKYNSKIEEAYSKLWNELSKINKICQKSNIKLVVFLVPTKEQVDPAKLAEVTRFFNIETDELELTKPQSLIRQFLSDNQIMHIDLLDTLRIASNNKATYFDLDSHWNEYGNAVVAEKIFNDIKKNDFGDAIIR